MSTKIASRRRQRRYVIATGKKASVEFEYPPTHGRVWCLPLVDISASGVSFSAPQGDLPPIDTGTSLAQTVIRVGDCTIEGDLVVMHLSREPHESPVCGALLYPTTDGDLLKLKALIAGMDAVEDD